MTPCLAGHPLFCSYKADKLHEICHTKMKTVLLLASLFAFAVSTKGKCILIFPLIVIEIQEYKNGENEDKVIEKVKDNKGCDSLKNE